MDILIFFVVLVVLILVHEFGHFIVAKIAGIRVDEFGIGFPPKLFGKKIGETEYSINALPIGGFVRIWGENPTEDHYEEGSEASGRSFVKQSRIVQALVLVAGVGMNIFLAFVLFVLAFMIGIPTAINNPEQQEGLDDVRLLVSSVVTDSPADENLKASDEIVGLRTGDRELVSEESLSPDAVSTFISESEGPVTFEVLREGTLEQFVIEPKTNVFSERPELKAAGFSMTLVGIKSYPIGSAIVEGAKRTYVSLVEIGKGLSLFFAGIFTGSSDFSQITGPVGIVGLVGDAAALGFTWLLTFSAFISLNLAIINLLPFPALDGGRLVFVGIESVIRRPINPGIANLLNQIGFVALLALMAIVTFQDISKLF